MTELNVVYNALNATQRAEHGAGIIPLGILNQFRPRNAAQRKALAYHHAKTAVHGQHKPTRSTALTAEARHRDEVSNLKAQSMKDAQDAATQHRRKREKDLASQAGERARFKADIETIQKLTAEADEAPETKADTAKPEKPNRSILAHYAGMPHGPERKAFWNSHRSAILNSI